jgi:hypothetical protein
MTQLLVDACAAFVEQHHQLAMLEELRDAGPAGLSDPTVENRVVPEWRRSEAEFEARRTAINENPVVQPPTSGGGS